MSTGRPGLPKIAKSAKTVKTHCFSLNTFRYKGLLNCAGEHRGELCWESADFRAERPRPLLLLFIIVVIFSLPKWPSKEKNP